jgi:hypothetical protein
MKRILTIALVGMTIASALALAQAPDRLERRVQQLEQTIQRMEKRLADLEAKSAGSDRRGMMGGGMMGGGKPNEQWRAPDSGR